MFKCLKCNQQIVSDKNIGTLNRNHCPYCLWSKHVDQNIPGDRKSTCNQGMKPIGLTFKLEGLDKWGKEKQGELMLIHECIDCKKISINRIANDDIPEKILEILKISETLNQTIKEKLEQSGIKLLTQENLTEIKTQLFGHQPGKLVVITGATVSGKDTIMAELLKNNPLWKKVVTTTTRPIRPNEQNGIDYYFVNRETFQKMKENDEFLETVEYAGNNYGTTKFVLNQVLQGQILIWRIDASRAAQVGKLFDNVKVIYIKLPDNETRQKHFLKRGMEESDIRKRIKQDEIDWNLGNFKNIVINYDGQLEKTVQQVEEIINS